MRARAHAATTDRAQMRVECADGGSNVSGKAGAFCPVGGQSAYSAVDHPGLGTKTRTEVAERGMKLAEELGIGIAAPGVIIHGFMARRADADEVSLSRCLPVPAKASRESSSAISTHSVGGLEQWLRGPASA